MLWILGPWQGLSDQCIGVRFAICSEGKTYRVGCKASGYIVVIEIHNILILPGYRAL